jgi:hypothetical protein
MHEYGVGIKDPLFFVGVIEDNIDPRKEGRCKVRAFGVHGTNKDITAEDLPWAIVVQGDYNPNTIPKLNSWVFGMFLDGRGAQQPMVLGLIPSQMTEIMDPEITGWGSLPKAHGHLTAEGSDPESFGQPQNHRLARAENIEETYVLQQETMRTKDVKMAGGDENKSWSEPSSAYDASYTHNRVIHSGANSIEIDSTPGHERIMIWHQSGSYVQVDSRGTKTDKSVSDKYEVNDRNQHVSVSGMSTVTIMGNSYVYVEGNKIEEINGDLQQLVHGNYLLSVGQQATMQAGNQVQIRGADVKMEANVGTMSIKAEKELQTEAGIGWYAKAPFIWSEATTNMNIKANNMNLFATTEMNIKSADLNIIGTGTTDIRGGVLTLGSDGELHVRGTTVHIDDNVNMANGDAATAHADGDIATSEPSKGATSVEAPEPVAVGTSTAPKDLDSMGTSGIVSQDEEAIGVNDPTVTVVGAVTQPQPTPKITEEEKEKALAKQDGSQPDNGDETVSDDEWTIEDHKAAFGPPDANDLVFDDVYNGKYKAGDIVQWDGKDAVIKDAEDGGYLIQPL